MKLIAEISIQCVTMTRLMQCHKEDEVLGYCAQCSNYMKNHSCPDFDFEVKDLLKDYSHVAVIMTRIDTAAIKAQENNLKDKAFDSDVFTRYAESNDRVSDDWQTKLSMYVFDAVKAQMTDKLLEVEKSVVLSLGLPPGACTRCSKCLKNSGLSCLHKNDLRYSLEALGFLVSDIYRDIFSIDLKWTQNALPDSFNTCSAVLLKAPINTDRLEAVLGKLEVVL